MNNGFENFLAELEQQTLPPVENWRPRDIRDMDLRIDRNGIWYYLGTPFQRLDLVKLLSRIMVREDNEYFLKSPTEKLRISVEDVPFIATDFESEQVGRQAKIIFETNTGFKVIVDNDHPIVVRTSHEHAQSIPYLIVKDGLEARLSRPVYYRLIELGVEENIDNEQCFGIWSGGVFFSLGNVESSPQTFPAKQ